MRTHHYPSDVTDAQWALLEPHRPVYPGGRSRKTDVRDVVAAIFYILRTGCRWRYLPKDLPPESTVWRYFDEWRHHGTLGTLHDLLRRQVRTAEKPYHPRTTASVDSPSVDTTSGGEQPGRDDARDVDGRERHIVVDSMGLLLAIPVTAADADDAKAAADLFARRAGQPVGQVVRMYADAKSHNFTLYEWVEANAGWDLTIVRRPQGSEGRGTRPIRWTVERTFAWLGPMPPPEPGPGEERLVVGGVPRAGQDRPEAQPTRAVGNGRRVPLPRGGLTLHMGQTLSVELPAAGRSRRKSGISWIECSGW